MLQALFHTSLAGVPGFEPGLSVLETDVLTVDTIPLRPQTRGLGDTGTRGEPHRVSVSPRLRVGFSLRLFMISVFAATATELAELKPIRRGFLILGRYVVATLAINTLKNNIIAWHLLNS